MTDASFAHGLVGVTLDNRYRLDAVLGEGGMGSVFRATHLAMDRKVAVKLLKPHLTSDETALQRFAREARATQKVESPHAVKILDYGVTPGRDYYMVLEYLDGRTVQRELEIDGAFAPVRVAHIARQALHALATAHGIGLIHRDVKPDNLLLMRSGADADYTKILDFGVAKLMQGAAGDPAQLALTAAGMVFGTPEYMSPEQACGQPLDGRSDLYSLAVTMFVMLTAMPPFEAATAIEWLTHHARTPAPRLAMVRPCLAAYPALDDLLQRCLAKQRERRPASAVEMAQLITAVEPTLARASGASAKVAADGSRAPRSPSRESIYVEVLRDPATTSATRAHAATAPPQTAAHAAPPRPPMRWRYIGLGSVAVASLIGVMIAIADRAPSPSTATATATATAAGVSPAGTSAAPSIRSVAPAAPLPGTAAPSPSPTGAAPSSPTGAAPSSPTGAAPSSPTGAAPSPSPTGAAPSPSPTGSQLPGAPTSSTLPAAAPPAHRAPQPRLASPAPPATAAPSRAASPARPSGAEAHLRAAEEAFRAGNRLRQLAEADLALRADPRSARARYLVADALLKSGDLDRGCEHLRAIKRSAAARDRARAAGCPGD